MKLDRYQKYFSAQEPIKSQQLTWPLYGAGIDSLGKNGEPVVRDIPTFADDELLMRIDAVSLCYTDVKEIDAGDTHPRLTGRNLKENPIIPGHEVSFTVVGVGKELQKEYTIGDRYTMQPDIWVDGKSIPFSFGMDGGYRQYAKIGREALRGDAGNYLIPVPADMPYASSAITEPWACVEAAYRMEYRSALKAGGTTLFLGGKDARSGYQLDAEWFKANPPAKVVLSGLPDDLKKQVTAQAQALSVSVQEASREELFTSDQQFEDIILLDVSAGDFDQAVKALANFGTLAVLSEKALDADVQIDLGRLHYDSTYFVGAADLDIAAAYQQSMPRVALKPNGKTWILGAGGPMGRLHLQRAIESDDGPGLIVASEVTESRYQALIDFFAPFAKKYKKELLIVNSKSDPAEYKKVMDDVMAAGGFDDIQIMVAVPAVIADSLKYAARGAVIDLFAGLKRGVSAAIDFWQICGPRQARFVGHSGSGLDDQKAVVDRAIAGQLKPELSVAAIGGIRQVADGIRAMKNWVYPGKIVIFPHVVDFPLMAIDEIEKRIPEIADSLGVANTWTLEAEKIFLEKELNFDE